MMNWPVSKLMPWNDKQKDLPAKEFKEKKVISIAKPTKKALVITKKKDQKRDYPSKTKEINGHKIVFPSNRFSLKDMKEMADKVNEDRKGLHILKRIKKMK